MRAARLAGLARRPLESLPAKIVLVTFVATLAICASVTWFSARSTEHFLRARLEQKYPALLGSVSERLALGYSHRQLEMETFARSATLVQGLRQGGRRDGSREAARYLDYVLQSFPQFEALFALDPEGDVLAWAGPALELPWPLRRRLAALEEPSVGDVQGLDGRRIQVVSSPVRGPRGERRATLHALVALAMLEARLVGDELTGSAAIYVLGRDGRTLLASPGAPPRARTDGSSRPAVGDGVLVAQYTGADGREIVGGARAFPRFGWTLVVEEPYTEAFAPVVALVRSTLLINLLIVLTFGLFAFQVARSIVRPVVALSSRARRIAAGESGVELPVSRRADEIGILTRAIHEMTGRLHANQLELEEKRREIERANLALATHNVQLQQMNETLEQLSITDELTRLHNHRFFQDHLPQELKRSLRTAEPLALLMIDIDDFKGFNDRYGHAAGDEVLRRAAEVMNELVREMDLLCRYGGEEFVLLAAGTDLAGAVKLAEKIRGAMEAARFEVEDAGGRRAVSLTVSIGVAPFKGDGRAFFNAADGALYRAKRQGKNCVVASE